MTCSSAGAWFGDLAGLTNYCARTGEPCAVDGDCTLGTCGVDGVIHIQDQGIVPSRKTPPQPATFSVRIVDQSCDILDEASYSAALTVTQPLYGDVLLSNATCPTGPPNNNPDISDVLGVLNKFSNAPCAAKKTRADLEPGNPDSKVGIPDVLQALNGFGGLLYSFAAPTACPP